MLRNPRPHLPSPAKSCIPLTRPRFPPQLERGCAFLSHGPIGWRWRWRWPWSRVFLRAFCVILSPGVTALVPTCLMRWRLSVVSARREDRVVPNLFSPLLASDRITLHLPQPLTVLWTVRVSTVWWTERGVMLQLNWSEADGDCGGLLVRYARDIFLSCYTPTSTDMVSWRSISTRRVSCGLSPLCMC